MKPSRTPPVDKVMCLKLLGFSPKEDVLVYSFLYDVLDFPLPARWRTCADKKKRVYFVDTDMRYALKLNIGMIFA